MTKQLFQRESGHESNDTSLLTMVYRRREHDRHQHTHPHLVRTLGFRVVLHHKNRISCMVHRIYSSWKCHLPYRCHERGVGDDR